jgi:predicted DNA-binding transcriptional regulator YafY
MRADRLISIVMLLQTHERMTAEELSKELEVSPRTIYRDITSLNIAGVPVYTDRGPGGGIALVESYRTTLTGLNEDEARALFMLSIPEPLVALGVDQKLKAALLKLAVALPPAQRAEQTRTRQRIHLDSSPWSQSEEPVPQLGVIQQAVWQDHLLWLVFQGNFDAHIEVVIAPLGLVAKGNTWYLVGIVDGYMRVIKVRDILEARILDQRFERDEDFDIGAFWQGWCRDYQDRRPSYMVRIKVAPELKSRLPLYFGEAIKNQTTEAGSTDTRGWIILTLRFENFFMARERILSFGRAAEVLEPEALRLSVIDFARQIVDFYQER